MKNESQETKITLEFVETLLDCFLATATEHYFCYVDENFEYSWSNDNKFKRELQQLAIEFLSENKNWNDFVKVDPKVDHVLFYIHNEKCEPRSTHRRLKIQFLQWLKNKLEKETE